MVLGSVACYTCLLVVRHGMRYDDYTVMVRMALGPAAQYVGWTLSVLIMLGAAIAYHILMEQTLFQWCGALMEWTSAHHELPAYWTPKAAALVILVRRTARWVARVESRSLPHVLPGRRRCFPSPTCKSRACSSASTPRVRYSSYTR